MIGQPRLEHHKFVLVNSYPSGVDELFCPTCGRRVIIQWPPDYKKTVLNAGNEYAIHSGGKDGLEMGTAQNAQKREVFAQNAAGLNAQDESRLVQWERWLGQMGFENLWSG